MDWRSNCKVSMSSTELIPLATLVSSAKLDKNVDVISLSMSPIKTKNKRNPSTDPWGTPELTSDRSLLATFTMSACFLSVRKEYTHCPSLPDMPMLWSFLIVTRKSTLSKALVKSRYTTSTFWPLSSNRVIWSKWAISWLRQNLPKYYKE